jgi:hypothetical protein
MLARQRKVFRAIDNVEPHGKPMNSWFWKKCVSFQGICIFVGLLLVGGCGGIVWRIQYQIHAAKKFCESLVPVLEREWKQTGRYPATLHTSWWKGKEVPMLIELDYLYFPDREGTSFYLAFQNPYAVWDYEVGFSSIRMEWDEHDSNPRTAGSKRNPPYVDRGTPLRIAR